MKKTSFVLPLAAVVLLAVALGHSGCYVTKYGSWGQVIKSATLGTSDDDAAGTVAALLATNQSFIVYNIDSEDELEGFLELAYAIGTNDIDLYAAVDAPHLNHADSRLFDLAGVEEPDCECTGLTGTEAYDCEAACIETWLEAWIAAAEEVSQKATMYGCIKGFVINDFDGYVESVDYPACRFGNRLTRAQVQQIRDAVKSVEDLGFWPVCYPASFGRVIGDGYVLGANYGVKVFPADKMSVKLSFTIKALPQVAKLSFLHADSVGSESDGSSDCYAYDLFKRLAVNGVPLWSESMAGNQSVQLWEGDVAGLLGLGDNTIELSLESDAATATNGCGALFWRCWRVMLDLTAATSAYPYLSTTTVSSFTPTYEVTSDETAYTPNAGCYGAWLATELDTEGQVTNTGPRCAAGTLADSETAGRAAGWLVAAPSTDYLIHDLVDGIVAPWFQSERPDYESLAAEMCTNGPAWPLDPRLETFNAALATASDALGRSKLMVLGLGLPLAAEVNLDIAREQLESATDYAENVGLWNMANGVQLLGALGGVFAARDPATLTAVWPGRQSALPGWYQRWTCAAFPAGTTEVYVTVTDTRSADSDALGLVVWRVYDSTSPTSMVEGDVSASSTPYGPIEVDVGGPIVLEVALVGGVGNWGVTVRFDVIDAAGTSLVGAPWVFDSGVSWDTQRAFEMQRSLFLSDPGP